MSRNAGNFPGAAARCFKESMQSRPLALAPWALLVATLGTLIHATDAPLWSTDAAVLSLHEAGAVTGRLSTALARLLASLPLGSRSLRTTLLGALGSGVVAYLLWTTTRTLLQKEGERPRVHPWLALAAALGATFSIPFMTEATVAAGGAVPRLLPSLWLATRLLASEKTARAATRPEDLALGALLGIAAAESPWAALGVLLLASPHLTSIELRRLPWLIGPALGVLAALVGPALAALTPAELRALSPLPPEARFPAFGGWELISEVGLLLSFGGLALLFVPGRGRRVLWSAAGLLLLDVLVPAAPHDSWLETIEASPARTALHLLTLATLAMAGAVGLGRLLDLGLRLGALAPRPSAALFTVLALAMSVAGLEDAHRFLRQSDAAGTRAWTSAALDDLPSGAVVLTSSAPVGRRLRAAQLQGERTDVLVVRLDHLAQAGVVERTLAREPALEPLILDLCLGKPPSERALSVLEGVRPVYVEPSPDWEPRLLEHVEPALPLAAFSPHPLAHSERQVGIEQAKQRILRVLAASQTGVRPDRATEKMMRTGQALLLRMLQVVGDGRSAATLAGDQS